jgi:hypothetical protein
MSYSSCCNERAMICQAQSAIECIAGSVVVFVPCFGTTMRPAESMVVFIPHKMAPICHYGASLSVFCCAVRRRYFHTLPSVAPYTAKIRTANAHAGYFRSKLLIGSERIMGSIPITCSRFVSTNPVIG